MNQSPDSAIFPVLIFNVGDDHYALPIEDVLEVAAMVELTPVSDAPPEVLGIADRHGMVLPMLDLRKVFKGEAEPVTASTLFIVARRENKYSGLVVDDIDQVEYVSQAQLTEASITGKYIRGIMNHKSRLIQIVSLSALWTVFQADEMAEDKK
jgi:purine-binding chemotaxis protein CheW